jgi:hypothetical protein
VGAALMARRVCAAFGTGKLLSKSSFHTMTDPNLLGFGHKQDNCLPSCFTQVDGYNYGLGIARSGSWILQNPLVGGYSATEAYLPSQKTACFAQHHGADRMPLSQRTRLRSAP